VAIQTIQRAKWFASKVLPVRTSAVESGSRSKSRILFGNSSEPSDSTLKQLQKSSQQGREDGEKDRNESFNIARFEGPLGDFGRLVPEC